MKKIREWEPGKNVTQKEKANRREMAMYNEKSRKNLKKFSKGHQPPRRGRRKGSVSFTNALKKVLEGVDPVTKKTILELLALAATKHAMKGNAAFFREILSRVDGKVPERVEADGGKEGKKKEPFTFKVVYEDWKKKD
jgi:hypothetical protein